MDTPSRHSAESNELKLFLIGTALLIGFILLTSRATRQNAPEPAATPPPYRAQIDYFSQPDQADARVDQLAKQFRGDFSKLPGADQDWLNAMTGGHGREFLKGRYEAGRRASEATSEALEDKSNPKVRQ